MNYFVLPEKLLKRYHEMFEGYYCSVPWLEQKVKALYMTEGHWVKRVNHMFAENKRKRDILLETINKLMAKRVKISGESSGTHIMLEITGFVEDELVSRALEHNVIVSPIKEFWYDQKNIKNNSVIIGFNAINENDIEQGIKSLNKAWFG